jgi:hypothetical protein
LGKPIQTNLEDRGFFSINRKSIFIPGTEIVNYLVKSDNYKNFGFLQPVFLKIGPNLLTLQIYKNLLEYTSRIEVLSTVYPLQNEDFFAPYLVCEFLKTNRLTLNNNSAKLISLLKSKAPNNANN